MDIERVRQIVRSPERIDVLYQGTPVWIESIMNDNTVEVTNLETRNRFQTSVNSLVER